MGRSRLGRYLEEHRAIRCLVRIVAFVPCWTLVVVFAVVTFAVVLLRWAMWPLRVLLR